MESNHSQGLSCNREIGEARVRTARRHRLERIDDQRPQSRLRLLCQDTGLAFIEMPTPDMEDSIYYIAHAGGEMVAGIMDLADMPDATGIPPHWFTYINVDDVDASVAKAIEAGGNLMRPVFDVTGIGRIGLVQDPTGAAIGLMKYDEPK